MTKRVDVSRDDNAVQFKDAIVGDSFQVGKFKFAWFGWKAARWRRFDDHVDVGPLTIIGPEHHVVLKLSGWIIKPMRWWWHRRFKQDDILP